MSNGMADYWKQKKMREIEIIAEKARDSVARAIGRPDLDRSRKRRPILMINQQRIDLVDLKDIQMDIGIKPIEVLGKFEVEEIDHTVDAFRYTLKSKPLKGPGDV